MKKQQDLLDVALATFYRSEKGSKIRRAVRTIGNRMRICTIKQLGSLVERIAQIMTRESFTPTGEIWQRCWQRNLLLGETIAEHIFNVGDLPFMCRNFFGCEKYLDENGTEHAPSPGRQFLIGRLFTHIGSSLDCTLRFCRLMFGYLVKLEEDRVKDMGRQWEEGPFEWSVMRTIVNSMSAPAVDDAPQKLWVNNLIEAAARGNDEATEFFKAAAYHCFSARHALSGKNGSVEYRRHPTIVSQSEYDEICPDRAEQLKVDYARLRIVVTDRLKEKVFQVAQRVLDETESLRAEATSFLEWFTSHAAQIGARFDAMGNEILTGARYGVRPMGFDSFLVNVSALRSVGVASFSFYPEGERFPNLKVAVMVRRPGLGLCQLWMHLQDFELEAVDDVFQNWQGFNVPLLRSVLEYIVVDGLHRIVMPKPKKDLDDEEVERTLQDVTPAARVRVRPFIRRLPLGFEASDEARRLAYIHMGWILLQGMTFVRSHDRWVDLPAGKPAPLFKYTDEVVRKSIGSV